ncbi:hypothetical protein R2A130_1527 [Ahrensia sp. R2A130]|nr:hypothetical protein R2A130_1527 [Ahrensia sp. R2A130]
MQMPAINMIRLQNAPRHHFSFQRIPVVQTTPQTRATL